MHEVWRCDHVKVDVKEYFNYFIILLLREFSDVVLYSEEAFFVGRPLSEPNGILSRELCYLNGDF